LLRVEGLIVRRWGLRLYVERLEVAGRLVLLGRNGAGKSTLLATLAGLYRPSAGKVYMEGMEVTDLPPERRGIGYLPQHPARLPLRPRRALEYFSRRWGVDYMPFVRRLGAGGLLEKQALSDGEQQLLNLCILLMREPRCLLLDEPTSHLDWENRRVVWAALRELDLPLLLVTHDPLEALLVGERAALLKDGLVRGPIALNTADPREAIGARLDLYGLLEGLG